MKVLVVENNGSASARLCAYLASEGTSVDATDTGEEALKLLRRYEVDVVVLNLGIRDMDGNAVIRRIRGAGKSIPILALTNAPSAQPKVSALAAGADDVVAQSVDLIELLARLRAIVRRSRGHSKPMLQAGSVTLDLERHEVSVDGSQVPLSRKEFEILRLLMIRKNVVLPKETILNLIYGGMDEPELKIIDVFVCKLRKKLAVAGAPDVIATVWGRGYTIRDISRYDRLPAAPTNFAPSALRIRSALVPA